MQMKGKILRLTNSSLKEKEEFFVENWFEILEELSNSPTRNGQRYFWPRGIVQSVQETKSKYLVTTDSTWPPKPGQLEFGVARLLGCRIIQPKNVLHKPRTVWVFQKK